MTSKALIRLHIPTMAYISRGSWRLPAANERAPDAKTKRWKGVSDLPISISPASGIGKRRTGHLDLRLGPQTCFNIGALG
jgi:hypothetical protein